jgi:hypothetical protein
VVTAAEARAAEAMAAEAMAVEERGGPEVASQGGVSRHDFEVGEVSRWGFPNSKRKLFVENKNL